MGKRNIEPMSPQVTTNETVRRLASTICASRYGNDGLKTTAHQSSGTKRPAHRAAPGGVGAGEDGLAGDTAAGDGLAAGAAHGTREGRRPGVLEDEQSGRGAGLQRPACLGDVLVGLRVAVQEDLLRIKAGLQRDRQLPVAGDVAADALLREDPRDRRARQRLGGEVDLGARVARRELAHVLARGLAQALVAGGVLAQDVCAASVFMPGSHQAESTATDETLACAAAASMAGATMRPVIADLLKAWLL